MTIDQTVQSFYEVTKRGSDHFKSYINSSKTRLVWFVGISGFALLNGEKLWGNISSTKLEEIDFFLLTLPWLLSIVLALISHYVMDQAEIKFNIFNDNKLSMIDLHGIEVKRGEFDANEFELLLFDKHPDIIDLKKTTDKYLKWANRLELITFIFLVIGFIWSVIYPIFIMCRCQ